ncbi:hypothetical protein SAMN04489743_3398 [Pseudarthrobacter equi]|uniref:Uncharacterized protein n=1 Tax=Pseudarthrobacter equi TaxID=728066 RepID=A0A1H2B3F4_9MICC|nr:hypothetical protein SAMN04489743_3398 [Pseudarthrobacter equi]
MNSSALLSLLADLYAQVAALTDENNQLRELLSQPASQRASDKIL